MIAEKDLQEAIAECQGMRNPTANTCIKLAAFYTIKDHLYPQSEQKPEEMTTRYSFATGNGSTVDYISETEFGQAVEGKNVEDIMSLMDEVMSVVQVINPKLYNSIMERI